MKIKEIIVKNAKWIILFICLTVFFGILENVLARDIMNLDIVGYEIISKYLISDSVTPIAKIITIFGGAIFLITLSTLILIFVKDKKIGFFVWLNLGISTILNQTMKFIIRRPRPTEFRIVDESGYSFPSGHSMVSVAFYGFLIYIIYKKIKNKYLKWSLIIALSVLVTLIGLSRIYLGVHYVSDVVGGFLISVSYLIMYTSIIKNCYEIS